MNIILADIPKKQPIVHFYFIISETLLDHFVKLLYNCNIINIYVK